MDSKHKLQCLIPKCTKVLSTDQALQYHMQSSSCKVITPSESESVKYDYEFHANLKGDIIYLSKSFSKLLNYSYEQIIGTKGFAYVHSYDIEFVRDLHVDFLLTNTAGQSYMRLIDKEGNHHFVNHFHKGLNENGLTKIQIYRIKFQFQKTIFFV